MNDQNRPILRASNFPTWLLNIFLKHQRESLALYVDSKKALKTLIQLI